MLHHKKLNNVQYRQIKTNKLFYLDWKSRFKTNNYSNFYLFMLNSSKNTSNGPKVSKNVPQYSTVFDFKKGICFICKTKMLACVDPIWEPNIEKNTEYV